MAPPSASHEALAPRKMNRGTVVIAQPMTAMTVHATILIACKNMYGTLARLPIAAHETPDTKKR